MRRILLTSLATLILAATQAQASSILFTTDQTGANTQIDAGEDEIWTFNVTSGTINDVNGQFVIKRGPGTDDPITFSLYSGTPPAGTLIASFSRYSNIDTDPPCPGALCSVDNAYGAQDFNLPGVNIGVGAYYVRLWSTVPTGGSDQYFFKNGSIITAIDPPCGEGGPCITEPEPVAEPSSLSLLGLGLLAGFRATRRRS